MSVLIDTHIFLWFIARSPQLDAATVRLLESEADILLGIASIWEIAIKVSVGKLSLEGEFQSFLNEQIRINKINLLPIEITHLKTVSALPFHHRDPFDRLIVAQAMVEDVRLVSVDKVFEQYDVKIVR